MIRVGDGWAPSGPEFARYVRELLLAKPMGPVSEAFAREYDRVYGANSSVNVMPDRNEDEE